MSWRPPVKVVPPLGPPSCWESLQRCPYSWLVLGKGRGDREEEGKEK